MKHINDFLKEDPSLTNKITSIETVNSFDDSKLSEAYSSYKSVIFIENFKEAYNNVFDENHNIRFCGRQKCIELIEAAEKVQKGSYGNVYTGLLDIDNVKSLYNKLFTV